MSSRRLARTIVSGLGVVLGVGAVLLLGGSASAHGDERHIEIEKYMYMPMATTIEQGTTVTWTNHDAVEHDVQITSGPVSFRSPMLAQGESWSHAFTVPGPYSYVCSVHPDMKATITVSPASPVVAAPKPATSPTTSAARPTARAAARVASVTKPRTPSPTSTSAASKATSTLVSAPQSAATLQPLILVVGASVAVVVFCLLLMASRPLVVDGREPKHLDE